MVVTDLERTIEEKIKSLVDKAMHEFLGVKVVEIERDITVKLQYLDDDPDIGIPFKQAKKLFKKSYLLRLLQQRSGNVAEAAKIAGIDRRSLHRLITGLGITVDSFREMKIYARQEQVTHAIEGVFDSYKTILHPGKIRQLYRAAPVLSKEILAQLPELPKTLALAEQEFERAYLAKARRMHGTIAATAKAIGLRYEVLHRKLKALFA
jgi:transcriptional regulator of acetoin/glycerol metabolism